MLRVFAGLLFLAVLPISASAELTSYHFMGPIAMMHDLPVGETPGWSSPTWFNLEIGTSNVWNHQASMTDTRNGNIYTIFADFEQETAVAEIGQALSPSLAFAVEVPYTNH